MSTSDGLPRTINGFTTRERSQAREEKIKNAIQTFTEGNGELSLLSCAKRFGVAESTLRNRMKGSRSRDDSQYESSTRLSELQERSLLSIVGIQTRTGIPVTKAKLLFYATQLANQGGPPSEKRASQRWNNTPISERWISRFVLRHGKRLANVDDPEVVTKITRRPFEATSVTKWLKMFQELIEHPNVHQHNIYNMDEVEFNDKYVTKERTSIWIDNNGLRNVFREDIKRSLKSVKSIADEEVDEEIVPDMDDVIVFKNHTLIETICADGTTEVAPFLIAPYSEFTREEMKTAGLSDDWRVIACGDDAKRYNRLRLPTAMKWLEHFDKHTKAKASDGKDPRVLILDGHGSHIAFEFLLEAVKRNIVIVVLSSHMSPIIQPLERYFDNLKKKKFKQLILDQAKSEVGIDPSHLANKTAMAKLIGISRAFTANEKIASESWELSGLFPFDAKNVLSKVCEKKGLFKSDKELEEILKSAGIDTEEINETNDAAMESELHEAKEVNNVNEVNNEGNETTKEVNNQGNETAKEMRNAPKESVSHDALPN